MDCCGQVHGSMHPAGMWSPALASVEVMLAGGVGPAGSSAAARTAEGASAALDVIRRSISIDVHAHGGRTGITSKAPPSSDLANAMRVARLTDCRHSGGLYFLDGKQDRRKEAHQPGLRHLQLVHYTPNDIGDFQTGTVTHDGLTEFGAEVIRVCHRLGFVCDVAHATEEMVKQAVKVATKPLMLSHTAMSGSHAMGSATL